MRVARGAAIAVFLLGAGWIAFLVIRSATSGEVVGHYPLAAWDANTTGERIDFLRKPAGFLGSTDLEAKVAVTEFAPFSELGGPVDVELALSQHMATREYDDPLAPSFLLLDATGSEIFRREWKGPMPASGRTQRGFDRQHRYPIGRFAPEAGQRHRLLSRFRPATFAAHSGSLFIETRRGVIPPDLPALAASGGLFLAGVVLLVITRRAR